MLNIFLKLLRCDDLIGDLSQEYAVHTPGSVIYEMDEVSIW